MFNPGTGFAWAAWHDTDGAQGIEPPEDIRKLWDLSDEFVQVPLGSEESNRIGAEITDIHVDNMLKIGTVGDIVAPFLHHNTLMNVRPLTARTYNFYWAYPAAPAFYRARALWRVGGRGAGWRGVGSSVLCGVARGAVELRLVSWL